MSSIAACAILPNIRHEMPVTTKAQLNAKSEDDANHVKPEMH